MTSIPLDGSPAPIARAFAAILAIQRMRAAEPDGVPPEIDAAAAEVSAALAEHIDSTARTVERALLLAPDDDVRRRLDDALDSWRGVQASLDRAREELARGDDREAAARWLEDVLASSFSGATVRTQVNRPELLTHEVRQETVPGGATARTFDESGDDDLRPLHGDAFDAAIVACADALGRDPARIFAFVAALDHAVYLGHFRAPAEVLADRMGNDADLAGLLVELLRASGIRARLVYGAMRVPEATAAAWLDLRDPATIEQCLRDAGFTAGWSGGDGARVLEVVEHYRVRALLDGETWTDLDPAVVPYEIVQPGSGAAQKLPWTRLEDGAGTLEERYFTGTGEEQGPLAFYERELRASLGVATLDAELRVRRRAAPANIPARLPYEPAALATEQIVFRPSQEHAVALQLSHEGRTLLEHRFATPGRCRDRLVLRYEPATPTAVALVAAARSVIAAPAFALDLQPRLVTERENGDSPPPVDGTAHAPAAAPLHLRIVLEHPSARLTRASQAQPACGTEWTIALEPPGALASAVTAARDDPRRTLVPGARSWREFPGPLLRAYHSRLAYAAARVAQLAGAVACSGPVISMAAASLETFIAGGVAARLRQSGLLLDVRHIELHLYDSSGAAPMAAYVELFFAEGSYHEAQMFLERLGVPAISTTTALRAAVHQENPLVVIRRDRAGEVDRLQHPDDVRNALRFALLLGGRESIIIARRPIDFGARRLSAWIARGGHAPSSDYAIGALSGGYTHDEPDPGRPHVRIHDLPREKLTVAHRATPFEAFAWDDDGNDLTDSIRWSAALAGGGSGGAATYTPHEAGRYTITATVGGGASGLLVTESTGGASDSSECVSAAVEIERLVFAGSRQLHRVHRAPSTEVEPLGTDHYWRERPERPSPAVVVAGSSTQAVLSLRVAPMVSFPPVRLTIRGTAYDEARELFTLAGSLLLSGDFSGSVPLDVAVEGKLGTATIIRWQFGGLAEDPVEQETKVRVYVAAAAPETVPTHRYFDEVFDFACRTAKDASPSDKEAILDALQYHRSSSGLQFSYARDASGATLEDFLRVRKGHCGEVARWFRAAASVHGIQGEILWIKLGVLEPSPEKGWRWKSMRIALNGLNNPHFDDKNPLFLPPLVKKGFYGTHKTEPEALHEPNIPPFPNVWQFAKHQVTIFEGVPGPNGRPLVYDSAMHRGAKFEFPEPQKEPGLFGPDHAFRTGYLKDTIAYLVGDIWLSNGTKVTAMVDAEDVRSLSREPLKIDFQIERGVP